MSVRFDIRLQSWFYRFSSNGANFNRYGFATEREAKAAEAKHYTDVTSGKPQPTQLVLNMKFGEAAQVFYNDYAAFLSSKQAANYRYILPPICINFAGRKFSSITKEDIRGFMTKLLNSGLKAHTVNHYLAAIRAIYNWWIKEKDLPFANPASKVEALQCPKARVRFLYPQEESMLTKIVFEDARIWPYYLLALSTGLRLGNLCRMKGEDVDFSLGKIFVPTSKNGKSGYIPITEELVPILQALIKGPKQLVLGSYTPSGISHIFPELAKAADVLNFHFHDLRHTFAYHLLSQGESIYKVSKLLLHSSVRVTEEHYGHMAIQDLQSTSDKLSGVYAATKVATNHIESLNKELKVIAP